MLRTLISGLLAWLRGRYRNDAAPAAALVVTRERQPGLIAPTFPDATAQTRAGRQSPASGSARYKVKKKPTSADGYPQRIPMWEAVERLGGCTAEELLRELQRTSYQRPRAALNVDYCRIELTDMTRRGFLQRL
jgi:hypothetical protein